MAGLGSPALGTTSGGGGGGSSTITSLIGITTKGQATMSNSLPVVIASDQSSFPVTIAAGSAVIGHVITDSGSVTNATLQTQTDTVMIGGVNIKEINAVTPLMGNGTTGTGSLRVTIASDNTAFSVNATLSAETTKVIGVVRTADGSGNLLTSTGSALDVNLKTIAASLTLATVTTVGTVTTITNNVNVIGTKTNNNAAPGATNVGALVGIANAAQQTWTEGDQVLLSTNLRGSARMVIQDAALNDRGANVTAANELQVLPSKKDAFTTSSFTITLASLANSTAGVGRQSTLVTSNTAQSALIAIKFTVGTSPTANSLIYVYLIRGDGTLNDDNAGSSDAGLTVINAPLLGTILCSAATSNVAYYGLFDTKFLGSLGPTFGIAIVNSTGATSNATGGNFTAEYTLIT